MSQIQTLQCPACGANLSCDGGPETSFPCQFCGTTVLVPRELWPAGGALAAHESDRLDEVVRLARAGQEVEAVRLMSELSPDMSVQEALAAVNQLAGQARPPAPASASDAKGAEPEQLVPTRQAPPASVAPADARWTELGQMVQAGQKKEAVKLLREILPSLSGWNADTVIKWIDDRKAPAGDQTMKRAEMARLVLTGQRQAAIDLLRATCPKMDFWDAKREIHKLVWH